MKVHSICLTDTSNKVCLVIYCIKLLNAYTYYDILLSIPIVNMQNVDNVLLCILVPFEVLLMIDTVVVCIGICEVEIVHISYY